MSAAGMAARDGDSRRARNRQLVLFSAIAAVLLVAFAVWLAASGGKAPAPTARIEAELAGPGTAEESWTRRSEARLGVIEGRMREMEAEGRRLKAENDRLQGELRKNAENARAVIDRQIAFIDELRRANEAGAPADAPTGQSGAAGGDPFTGGRADRPAAGAGPAAAAKRQAAPLIERFELDGAPFGEPDGADAKPLSLWVPAGSHAEAVVLSGVDASAGISSQGDPRPVLLRLTGPAWTAAPSAGDGAALSVDLAGCTVTGAAHGDLSSEKVYARLRTLTCAGPEPGTVVETRVAGFVANAGKAGVRGPVVSREGALVEKAFLAGLVSGVGQGVSGAFAPQAVASGGAGALANTGLADIGRAGIGAGAASAGQKVADYLIRRAEQYQPVIQLRAGTRVTVVFIEGARLDGRPGVRREKKND